MKSKRGLGPPTIGTNKPNARPSSHRKGVEERNLKTSIRVGHFPIKTKKGEAKVSISTVVGAFGIFLWVRKPKGKMSPLMKLLLGIVAFDPSSKLEMLEYLPTGSTRSTNRRKGGRYEMLILIAKPAIAEVILELIRASMGCRRKTVGLW